MEVIVNFDEVMGMIVHVEALSTIFLLNEDNMYEQWLVLGWIMASLIMSCI